MLGLLHANFRRGGYSSLTLVDRITLPHLAVSSAMSMPNSVGEPARTLPSASRTLILGSARPALISLLSLSTISSGVFLGATMPNQALISYPGAKSAKVGRSG